MTDPLPGFRHPSETAYQAGCRCFECWRSRSRKQKRYRAKYVAGWRSLVDSAGVRVCVDRWVAAGFSFSAIGAAAGVSPAMVRQVSAGMHPQVRAVLAERICAVTAADLVASVPPDAWVPRVGAVRRLQGLQVMGWPLRQISPGHYSMIAELSSSPRLSMRRRNFDLVRAAYDEKSMVPGPSRSTRLRAAAQGFVPPLAWDDECIDDPAAVPVLGARVSLPAVERIEELVVLGVRDIPARLGVERDSVFRALTRAGRDDLALRVRRAVAV